MKMKFYKLSIILIMVFATSGCANQEVARAEVHDFYESPTYVRREAPVRRVEYMGVADRRPAADYHIVRRGENLYRIAEFYNLDYRSLARVNGINRRYEIYPGDQLSLNGVAPKQAWRREPAIYVPPVRSRPRDPIYTSVPASRDYPITVASFNTSSIKTTVAPVERTSWGSLHSPDAWIWPIDGQLVRDFRGSGSLHKGIDLRGKLGQPVRAAAAGKVVYAGDGLRSYGNLVIVKHSDKFLSAYAHNRRILVTEGVTVAQGQRIAEMGSSGTDSVKLHFEIRYDGNPVDPLQYLPTRR